eukprot:3691243-Amphidinium_carterae.2
MPTYPKLDSVNPWSMDTRRRDKKKQVQGSDEILQQSIAIHIDKGNKRRTTLIHKNQRQSKQQRA